MQELMTNRELVRKNRTAIMGVAAIWVMLFHSTIIFPVKCVAVMIKMGYLGVDIFVFMSGFSMWYSFSSCNKNWKKFIKRRLTRILTTFLPFAVIYLGTYFYKAFVAGEIHSVKEEIVIIFLFRWFVPFIVFCYFMTPMLSKFFDKYGYRYRTMLAMITGALIVAIPFVVVGSSVALMMILRVPEYIIGWFFAGKEETVEWNGFVRIGAAVIMYVIYYYLIVSYSDSFLADTGLYLWPAVFIVFFIVDGLSHVKYIDNTMFNFCGKYSLELYLWHHFVEFPIIDLFEKSNIKFDGYGIVINLVAIAMACFVSIIYKGIVSNLVTLVGARYDNIFK